jgi:Branched-chain amino acid transport protein (AzlD)
MIWAAVIATAVGCYLFKLAGLSVPPRVLERAWVKRLALLIPIALLAALAVTQTFSTGRHVVVDARAAGLAFAVVALILRAPFLVVVVGAAVVAAALRGFGWG